MKKENEWLNKEIKFVEIENKRDRNKNYDTITMIKCFVLFIPLIVIGISLNANESFDVSTQRALIVRSASAQWRCKVCRNYIYTDEHDWRGDYYCPVCGTKMGDE